jgi:hypothetical protein
MIQVGCLAEINNVDFRFWNLDCGLKILEPIVLLTRLFVNPKSEFYTAFHNNVPNSGIAA